MLGVALLLLQAAPGAEPPAVQPASTRTLTGRFMCDATVYEVQVTAAPLGGTGVLLERVVAGRAVDAGSIAEARRMVARLSDVQSLDVRCRVDGSGELSIYGVHKTAGAAPRRARLRATLRDGRITDVTSAVEQR